MKVSHIIIMLIIAIGSVSAQWVRPVASGSAAGGVFTWFGAFNVSDNVTSPVYCIGTYCIDTWPNMSIPGSYLNSSNLTFIRETINNSGEYNIFINYSNLLNAPTYTNMTDTRWNVTASRYLYNSSANGNLMFNDSVTDNYTWSSDGLVFYAPFNGDALDYSGYGNDGNTAVTYTTAYKGFGRRLTMDGTSALYSQHPSQTTLSTITQSLSISAWFRLYSNNTPVDLISKRENSTRRFQITIDGVNSRIYFTSSSATTYHDLYITYPLDYSQHNIIITCNSTHKIIYLDGINITSITGYTCENTLNNSAILTIGARSDSLAQKFNGTIDEVRIWNRSLSADEVMGLYKMKSEVFPPNSVRNVANISVTNLNTPSQTLWSYGFINHTGDIRSFGTTNKFQALYSNGPAYNFYADSSSNVVISTSSSSNRSFWIRNDVQNLNVFIDGYLGVGSITATNGALEIGSNISNISIYAVGDISGNNIIDRASYPEGEALPGILSMKSDGKGGFDFNSVPPQIKSTVTSPFFTKQNVTKQVEKCTDVQIPTTKQVEYTDEFGINSYYPETTYTTENQCKQVSEIVETDVQTSTKTEYGVKLGDYSSLHNEGIKELYAENCAQIQVFIDKGLLKPDDIKMKHCDLVVK